MAEGDVALRPSGSEDPYAWYPLQWRAERRRSLSDAIGRFEGRTRRALEAGAARQEAFLEGQIQDTPGSPVTPGLKEHYDSLVSGRGPSLAGGPGGDVLARIFLEQRLHDLIEGRVLDEAVIALPPLPGRTRPTFAARMTWRELSPEDRERFIRSYTEEARGIPLPGYYYGYLEGHDVGGGPAGLEFRMLGLHAPSGQHARAVVELYPGFGHGLEYDLTRVEGYVGRGLATFMREPVDHGLSAHPDPRVAAQRSVALLTVHDLQFHDEVGRIQGLDPRLSDTNGQPLGRIGVGSSMGARHLVDQLLHRGGEHGYAALFLDSPAFLLGPKYASLVRMAPLIMGGLALRSTRDWVARNVVIPGSRSMSEGIDTTRADYARQYKEARMGLPVMGLGAFDTPRFSRHLWQRVQDAVVAGTLTLPPTLLGVFPGDQDVDIWYTLAFALQAGGEQTFIRVTDNHDAHMGRRGQEVPELVSQLYEGRLRHDPDNGVFQLDRVEGIRELRWVVRGPGRSLRSPREVREVGGQVAERLGLPSDRKEARHWREGARGV
ncbi:MAG: hypothetical protein A3I75_08205 [Deltaproteobacteria bacterium RIFCSPLOWO2_02_FULL_50_16]|nr:MAG: hypothetical protein A3I75_08205 [Deltaproteobacteria bacterium RIFCSPLOWO2_02_FULL_50_16]